MFTWDVSIDGTNVAVLVPETGTIEYGRTSVFDQPALPVAVIDLVPIVGSDLATVWPEFALGGGVGTSGFTDTYSDLYAGPSSRLLLNAPVVITATTPSGFTDTYADTYSGIDLTRFTGVIQAIDYSPDAVRLTCLPTVESWSRIEVAGTDDTTPIPEESDIARVTRLCDEARVTITTHGTAGPTLLEVPVNTTPTPLLTQLQQIARDARGLVTCDRDGAVHYYTVNSTLLGLDAGDAVTLPAAITLHDPLTMSLDLGTVRTRVIVEYGYADVDTNVRPTVTAENIPQAAQYGWREYRVTVQLLDEADAQAHADALLASLDSAWTLPAAVAALNEATEAQAADVAALDVGQWLTLPTLPLDAPEEDYASPILGYTESLSATDWQISYHLAPSTITAPGGSA
jgi:hypothetical protein